MADEDFECEEQYISDSLRCLTDEEKTRLMVQDTRLVSDFASKKIELETKKRWDLFYKRNETRFFKDRHWTTREFEELADIPNNGRTKILLEVGCGVGNLVFPLLEENPNYFVYACDLSPRAIDLLKSHPKYLSANVEAFQADITEESSLVSVPPLDIVTLIFVLSAIHPDKFRLVVQNLFKILKPGGLVLLRDYGLYDMAQIRFKPGNKISENLYVRQDGTRSYFFSTEEVSKLFKDEGFEVVSCTYIHRRTVNKKKQIDVPRIFVQAKIKKPDD